MTSLAAYAAFLTTRWDEVEAVALACIGKEADRFVAIKSDCDWHIEVDGGMHVANLGRESWTAVPELATHIALHDPRKVLADLAAKRAVLHRVRQAAKRAAFFQTVASQETAEFAASILAPLAAPFRAHPDHPANADA